MKTRGQIVLIVLLAAQGCTCVYSSANGTIDRCKEDDFKRGRWIFGAQNCGLRAEYSHPLLEALTSPINKTVHGPYPFSNLCWLPLNCTAEKFSAVEFCRKLRGRGVLVVGDSISHQFYDALWMQLDAPGQPWVCTEYA
jgi:hypothetical protein